MSQNSKMVGLDAKDVYDCLNSLTDHDSSFKKINLTYDKLISDFSGDGSKYIEVARIALHMVMDGIFYPGFKEEKPVHSIVHSRMPLTIKQMLLEFRPYDFANLSPEELEQKLAIASSNFKTNKWNKYFAMNIFCEWNYAGLHMVFMQRHPILMRNYNPLATVVPGQIIKFIANSHLVFEDMRRAVKRESKRDVNLDHLKYSFVDFIERLIGQMAKGVREKIPLYSNNLTHIQTPEQYLQDLYVTLSKFHPAEGLTFDHEDFIKRLPKSCKERYNREESRRPQRDLAEHYLENEKVCTNGH